MGISMIMAAWILVMHMTSTECQGPECQILSRTTAQVSTFPTQDACLEMLRNDQTVASGPVETHYPGKGTMKHRTEWRCQPAADEKG